MTTRAELSQPPSYDTNALIARLYKFGAYGAGAILILGVVAQLLKRVGVSGRSILLDIAASWPTIAMLALWLVPVLSLSIAGVGWVVRDRRDWSGWIAIGIGAFLSTLWIFA